MPHVTLEISPQGPVLDIQVGVSVPRAGALRVQAAVVPPAVPIRALLDTGASMSAVDPQIVSRLQLTPTGVVPILTPSTGARPHQCNQYDVSILLVHPSLSFQFQAIPVIESCLAHQGFHALLGRDILARCLFLYNGDVNRFALAF